MKNITVWILICLLALSGCSPARDELNAADGVKFTDALGHEVTIYNAERVIAASGSFAQVWLLAGGSLTGTTQDTFDDGFANAEITTNIGRLHEPSIEQIIELDSDLVILSADIAGQISLYDALYAAGIQTAYFSVETFDDYLNMLQICTDITGRNDLYNQNGSDIQNRIQEIISRTEGSPNPEILLLRASSGKVTVRNSETMAGIMLKDMGCINIADSESSLLDNLSMEIIIQRDPDYIFVTIMGESEENAQKALMDVMYSNPAWASLSAVKNGRYITLPKDLFHQKPNSRWAEAYETLWEILYGEE